MKIDVNEADVTIKGGKLIINIDSDIEKILNANKVKLSALKPGEIFKGSSDIEYIVLEHFTFGTAILRKELLDKAMPFGDDNNWEKSSIKKFLNTEYLKELEQEFGEYNIISHVVNLLSLDGLDDYEISRNNKVSLLTIDQYRKYRKIIGDNMPRAWWLSTPDSTPSGYGASYVRCVNSGGGVRGGGADWYDWAVRPFCILESNIFVSPVR